MGTFQSSTDGLGRFLNTKGKRARYSVLTIVCLPVLCVAREEQQELGRQREGRMSALLKKRAKERAAALERRLRGEDVSGDEGGEEVEELAVYKVHDRFTTTGPCN